MKELSNDPKVLALQEQSALSPEQRQTLLVRTNNVWVPGRDVEYPAKLQELTSITNPDGEVECVVAKFDLIDGPNRVYPFEARIGAKSTNPGPREKRFIKGIRTFGEVSKPEINFIKVF